MSKTKDKLKTSKSDSKANAKNINSILSKVQFKAHKELQKNLDHLLLPELPGKTESLKIAVLNGHESYLFQYGNDYKFYDLASLTKPIFTMTAFMFYEDKIKSVINTKVVDLLPWFKASDQITVKDLLAHQSGAPALYPVFKNLNFKTIEGLDPLNALIREIPFDQKTSVYSDVGFFVLGAILEVIFNKPLCYIFDDLKAHFQFGQMHFNFTGEKLQYPVSNYAPTEDCPLRHKVIRGEVHDENCWKMGGVGPHAGLFGQIDDVVLWLKNITQFLGSDFGLNVKTSQKFSKSTQQSFLKKQKGDWRLGMMVPSKPVSSCGTYFSDQSYGHLGFTGTSFWVDPKSELAVVILSNRTYPNRDNKNFNILRPLIHNTIWETLK
jgi:serine-type D-Ala-D-Ala carboxypeptidase